MDNINDQTRIVVVTGANKGLGFEICRQLAVTGNITAILTARNEERGLEALQKLKDGDDGINVIFHRLDVADPSTLPPLVDFVKNNFGKLDILINNAALLGSNFDWKYMEDFVGKPGWTEIKSRELSHSYEIVKECFQVNYYGVKRMVEAFVPLLQLSDSPRILNVSSTAGKIEYLTNEWAKGVLNNVEKITEEKVDEVVIKFLNDFKDGNMESKDWPKILAAYTVSKASLNAYTRVVARKFPDILVNCACPGYVKTDITDNTGVLSVEDGAGNLVRVALLPDDGPSGVFFDHETKITSF